MYNLLLNQAAFQIVHIIGTTIEVIELIILAAYRLLSLLLSLAFFCQFFCTFFLFAVVSINRIDIFQLTDVLVLPTLSEWNRCNQSLADEWNSSCGCRLQG